MPVKTTVGAASGRMVGRGGMEERGVYPVRHHNHIKAGRVGQHLLPVALGRGQQRRETLPEPRLVAPELDRLGLII